MAAGDGRAVLVTGGSRGIGRAIAHAFAERGDRVAVHWGRSRERAERVLAELPGSGHVLVQADLADAGEVGAMVDRAAQDLGGLDVLVNNAGVFTAHPPLTTSYEEWQAAWAQTLAVNLLGAANATFRAVPHLIAAGGGAVVNVTSRGAFRGEPNTPAYGASKAGLNSFAQSMALALAPHGHLGDLRGARLRADRDGARGPRRAGAATRCGPSRRSAGWPGPRRWPPPCCGWPRPRRASPAARSST